MDIHQQDLHRNFFFCLPILTQVSFGGHEGVSRCWRCGGGRFLPQPQPSLGPGAGVGRGWSRGKPWKTTTGGMDFLGNGYKPVDRRARNEYKSLDLDSDGYLIGDYCQFGKRNIENC